MENKFKKKGKRTKYLFIALIAVVFLGAILFAVDFFIKKNIVTFQESILPERKKINIDFELLERVKEMHFSEKIEESFSISSNSTSTSTSSSTTTSTSIRGGRDNPFIIYNIED